MQSFMFLVLLTCAILAITPVSSDFYIYRMWQTFGHLEGGTESYSEEYAFFPGPPSCNDVDDRWHAQDGKHDVSGHKRGVRCEGNCGPFKPFDPKIVEFNNGIGHYTYYRDSDGELRDTRDNVIGHCHSDASDGVKCFSYRVDMNGLGMWYGNSMVYCETSLTACKVFYDPKVEKQC
ncbi:hypothetical protein N8I77_010014 [Diaporthe amygdali]|uniref:Uncharacterized protein n=1 Tax=Phomopsis amygdali TaxID=1214568 RepID=A0AAD9S7F4_PHOAM|nr:hypothetical protein N8I77_010014 [Diaporthe amygdali]